MEKIMAALKDVEVESKKENTKEEEAKKEDTKVEEAKKENTKVEEAKKEDTKVAEAKKEARVNTNLALHGTLLATSLVLLVAATAMVLAMLSSQFPQLASYVPSM